MMHFVPVNNLETVLLQARNGLISLQEFITILLQSDISVPSADEILENGSGFRPLLFKKEQDNMLAAFTDKTRLNQFSDMTPYCLVVKGIDLLRRIPKGYGLVINPGYEVGLDISPEGVRNIIQNFGRQTGNETAQNGVTH